MCFNATPTLPFIQKLPPSISKINKDCRNCSFTVKTGYLLSGTKPFILLWQKLKWKKIFIYKCDFFFHLMLKTFCHLDRANSIKNNLRTCNLKTGQFISVIKMVTSFTDQTIKKITFENEYLLPFQLHNRRNALL